MDLSLTGKTALITGASGGLGFATALSLVTEGARVIINGRDENRLELAAIKIKDKSSVSPEGIVADVATEAGVKTIASATDGKIDILVANAGGPPPGFILDHDETRWYEAHELTLLSAQRLSKMVLSHMKDNKWGRIIFITSIGVLQPIDELILSNTYRAAVTGMAKTLSNTYAKYGITVNCVCPGYTQTERLVNLMKNRADKAGLSVDETLQAVTSTIPAGRVGRAEELAALITFLASDQAGYITGCSIPVDGGLKHGLL